ncbi:MAG: histidine phosphatase family protein [Nitrospirales bacterium]|nr:histidine phosphatase family protein [Nitrospirales bacterium]
MKILLVIFLVFVNGCHSRNIHEDIVPVIHGKVLLRVYLVRHAEAKKNVVHVPWTPEKELDTLTVEGQRQAVAIGKFLKDKGIVAILSSPAGRTSETAKAIGQVIGLKEGYEVDPAFTSLRGGKGQDGNQISWAWREKQWALGQDPRPEGGESLSDGEIRAKGALNKLTESFPGNAVVIVSHGDICAALLGYAENIPMSKRYARHNVPTGSVSVFIMTHTGWYVIEEGRQLFE